MKLLIENWRKHLVETKLTKSDVDSAIQNASFNSNRSSSHRWSVGQPYIDYWVNQETNEWNFLAGIPDGTSNADNWKKVKSEPGESLQAFLARVKTEAEKPREPRQLNLFENWRKYIKEDTGGIPQSGPSSGTPTDAEPEKTKEITVSDILELPYTVAYHPDIEEIDADPEHEDRDWEVYEKVREYADYFEANPNLSNLPPIQIKGDWVIDGAHRINALRLATKKVPDLLDQTVRVEFLTGEYSGPGRRDI